MGKKAKDHRKKVAKRNEAIKTIQKKYEKERSNFLTNLIQREKEAGAFNSTPITKQEDIIGAPAPILTEQTGPIL